jgi:hypothetical protein
MGEMFIAIVWGTSHEGFDYRSVATILGVLIAIFFQFIYFTTDQEAVRLCLTFLTKKII